jgi:hypothetical protein
MAVPARLRVRQTYNEKNSQFTLIPFGTAQEREMVGLRDFSAPSYEACFLLFAEKLLFGILKPAFMRSC